MPFDDRAADRQPHAHTARLRGEEGVEEPIGLGHVDPDTSVLHGHQHLVIRVSADRITSSRGRSVTGASASTPLITRLMMTCWSWTRSPRTFSKAAASSTRNDT